MRERIIILIESESINLNKEKTVIKLTNRLQISLNLYQVKMSN